jgi:hypothetical protein
LPAGQLDDTGKLDGEPLTAGVQLGPPKFGCSPFSPNLDATQPAGLPIATLYNERLG